MTEIPLDKEIKRFTKHLENNPRIIFSAKFGDGKTYFLKKFKEARGDDAHIVTLFPLNYSVSQNEDIFEYIKRDIILQLKDFGLYESIDFDAFEQSIFSKENILELIGFLASALPGGELLNNILKKGVEIKDKYDEQRKDTIDEYLDKFIHKPGSIYERDAFTVVIENVVERIRTEKKRVVLLIEDLDRIDPQHVFRILNILGAHIDENENKNKFGFDNIIVVLDYEITKHIFHHFYGKEANYDGYMSKFLSHYPYEYSITKIAQDYLYEVIEEKCGLNRKIISEFNTKGTPYEESISHYIHKKSVRDIVKALDNIEQQYETCTYDIRNGILIRTDAPIVIFLAVLKRLQCNISDYILRRSIRMLEGSVGLKLLGDFMLKDFRVKNGIYFKIRDDGFVVFVDKEGELSSCSFFHSSGGVDCTENLDRIMDNAIKEAKSFVYDVLW